MNNDMIRLNLRRTTICMALFAAALLLAGCADQPAAEPARVALADLPVMQDNYPRAFFFRAAESPGKDPDLTYEEWERNFSRLMGIEGKVLDEELPYLSGRNIPFFTRFKLEHPDQFVLLHYNGNARDPRNELEEFSSGHWVYFNGAKVLSDVPAEGGETVIKVADPSLFKTNVGRSNDRGEDIGICELGADGKPDWNKSEQVTLVSVDRAGGAITVKRGQFGTSPRAFASGKAYAAAHVHEGPWGGERGHLMWFYNFSTKCPRDEQGRTAADVLVEDVSRRFEPGGALEVFDGIQFDVLRFQNRYHPDLRDPNSGRGMDIDNDGEIDQGVFDGIDTYGVGVVEFCRQLRERFPQEKLLLADGMDDRNQRAFGILNGIESEGFPHLNDIEMKDWSGGLNRHFYWEEFSRPPVFNYINHKFRAPGKVSLSTAVEIPFNLHRLAMAASTLVDAAICYSYSPKAEEGELVGIWDELVMGTERKVAWLGKPVGGPVHIVESGEAVAVKANFTGAVDVSDDGGAAKIVAKDSKASDTAFVLKDVPVQGPDLYVTLTVRSAQWTGYPPEVARLMWVGTPNGQRYMTWAGLKDFQATFYFSELSGKKVDLSFEIEGANPLWISNVKAYAGPDAMYREFENGVVLANPAPHPVTFDLAALLPGKAYRRLKASSRQDTKTNDGSDVGATVELPSKDALFLAKK